MQGTRAWGIDNAGPSQTRGRWARIGQGIGVWNFFLDFRVIIQHQW